MDTNEHECCLRINHGLHGSGIASGVAVLVPSTDPGVRRGERLYTIIRVIRSSNSSPRFERKTRKVAKLFGVRGYQRQIENERVAGNQQIIRADGHACRLQFKTQQTGAASGIRTERNFFHNVQ